jgi:hypothetical protein
VEGGERPTQHDNPPGPGPDRSTDADLDQWVKEVVDTLPPLTDEQRDLLALTFRKHRS